MIRYLFNRLAIFVPTLLVVSFLAFGLSKLAPGDPVELKLRGGMGSLDAQQTDLSYANRLYEETAERLGLDKPAFYFNLSSRAYPDTLYRILRPERQRTLRELIAQYGNWEKISVYHRQQLRLQRSLSELPDSLAPMANKIRRSLQELLLASGASRINSLLHQIDTSLAAHPVLQPAIGPAAAELSAAYRAVTANPEHYKKYLPDLKWYGLDNQYHRWLSRFVTGDFGTSYLDSRPVADKMQEALFWTLVLNGLALLLAFLLSVPLGVYAAVYRHRSFDRITTFLLFMLYSLPNFWIATMLVVFFTTPEYGMDFFPSMGPGEPGPEASWPERLDIRIAHLTLPVFCLTYGLLAFISRQVRGGMVEVLHQDYIRTARAKGLNERAVIWKHAFRNALFPLITMIGSILPALIAGSVAIEWIFNIPGMGDLTLRSIAARDWPVVYSVLMLASVLTMAGLLLADLLYTLVDPRVTFQKKRTG